MFTGMMWFDNDPKKSLTTKVVEAATHYRNKYGEVPDACFVNTKMLSEEMRVGVVAVRPLRVVLPGHLWIGVDDLHHFDRLSALPDPTILQITGTRPPNRENADLWEGEWHEHASI